MATNLMFTRGATQVWLLTLQAAMFGLAMFCITEVRAATDADMTHEYLTCIKKTGGVIPNMIECINAEATRQDARLNENYKKLMTPLSEARKKSLREAQRAWIQFRDLNCAFYDDPDGGQNARVAANECVLDSTVDRAKELKSLTGDR